MDAHDDTSVAYTYAWWLTGDEQAAGAAVRAAVGSPAVLAAQGAARLPALLAAVRDTTGPTPTMCPASEVALLHDAHGLALDEVAGLAAVDRADVRTELAHGRLEALTETVLDPFEHPERLGGSRWATPLTSRTPASATAAGRPATCWSAAAPSCASSPPCPSPKTSRHRPRLPVRGRRPRGSRPWGSRRRGSR